MYLAALLLLWRVLVVVVKVALGKVKRKLIAKIVLVMKDEIVLL
jgi:hypothetical protein